MIETFNNTNKKMVLVTAVATVISATTIFAFDRSLENLKPVLIATFFLVCNYLSCIFLIWQLKKSVGIEIDSYYHKCAAENARQVQKLEEDIDKFESKFKDGYCYRSDLDKALNENEQLKIDLNNLCLDFEKRKAETDKQYNKSIAKFEERAQLALGLRIRCEERLSMMRKKYQQTCGELKLEKAKNEFLMECLPDPDYVRHELEFEIPKMAKKLKIAYKTYAEDSGTEK